MAVSKSAYNRPLAINCFLDSCGQRDTSLLGKGKIPNLSPFPLPLFSTYARSLLDKGDVYDGLRLRLIPERSVRSPWRCIICAYKSCKFDGVKILQLKQQRIFRKLADVLLILHVGGVVPTAIAFFAVSIGYTNYPIFCLGCIF